MKKKIGITVGIVAGVLVIVWSLVQLWPIVYSLYDHFKYHDLTKEYYSELRDEMMATDDAVRTVRVKHIESMPIDLSIEIHIDKESEEEYAPDGSKPMRLRQLTYDRLDMILSQFDRYKPEGALGLRSIILLFDTDGDMEFEYQYEYNMDSEEWFFHEWE